MTKLRNPHAVDASLRKGGPHEDERDEGTRSVKKRREGSVNLSKHLLEAAEAEMLEELSDDEYIKALYGEVDEEEQDEVDRYLYGEDY